MKFYLVYKNNGLYDPVLDDTEPIYEPIDPEDFDRPSQPTEVFQIQQFLDPTNPDYDKPDLKANANLYDDIQNPNKVNGYGDINDPSYILLGTPKLSESRSLTASPFLLTPKPYRPFSTEPLCDIPDLEDPIILNPNYSDEFGRHGEDEEVIETRFKLPISEQYDPDWKKKDQDKVRKRTDVVETSVKEITERTTIETVTTKNIEQVSKSTIEEYKVDTQQMTKEEIEFTKKMKQEIDLDKIEMTATNIVNESIETAMTVAEEIKKEIDVELIDDVSNKNQEIVEAKSYKEYTELSTEKVNIESNEVCIKSDMIELNSTTSVSPNKDTIVAKQATNEIDARDNADIKVAKIVEKFKSSDITDHSIDERRHSVKQEIEETIETGSVRRKSTIFDKETVSEESTNKKDNQNKKSLREDKSSHVQESITFETTNQKTSRSKVTDENITSKLLAEQRAYTIGLQTIPNIRGTIHTNYHYNLLLKTFFIHLTDVMVALSRFILSEPVFSNESQEKVTKTVSKNEKCEKEIIQEEERHRETQKDIKISSETNTQKDEKIEISADKMVKEQKKYIIEENKSTKTLAKELGQLTIEENKIEDIQQRIEVDDKRNISGSKMAQLSDRKSEELTNKMDAVISEFQNKTGIEESEITERRKRRSRSRSQVEEEVMKESDPLEWLAKNEIHSSAQNVTEITCTKAVSSELHSTVQKKSVTHESRQVSTPTPKEKQMYVAIVEAHVFTNKDAIFEEELAEFSETASVQSADEVNIAIESNEAVSIENVAMKNREVTEEVADSTVEEAHATSSIDTIKEAKVQVAQEVTKTSLEEVQQKIHNQNSVQTEIKSVKDVNNIDIRTEQMSVKKESTTKSVVEKLEVINANKNDNVEIEEIVNESSYISVNDNVANSIELPAEEFISVKTEQSLDVEVSADIKVENVIKELEPQVESTELKVVKEHVIEVDNPPEIVQKSQTKVVQIEESLDLSKQDTAVSLSKFIDISESSSCEFIQEKSENYKSEIKHQETSFKEESLKSSSSKLSSQNLTLRTDLAQQLVLDRQSSVQSDENNNIDTPTPSTVPPTPLTDEYVFKLQIPLPKNKGIPIKEDEDPNIVKKEDFHEDPNIVKKKLVPHIETNLESPIIYDPPLPTPPEDKVLSPIYTKPGLRGGADNFKVEEILEIGRKSSLLASAIDETIKSIEEYKEQAGIETSNMDDDVEESKTEYTAARTFESFSKEETTVEFKQSKVETDYKVELPTIDKQINNAQSDTVHSKVDNVDIVEVDDDQSKSEIENNSKQGINGKVEELSEIQVNGSNLEEKFKVVSDISTIDGKQTEQSEIQINGTTLEEKFNAVSDFSIIDSKQTDTVIDFSKDTSERKENCQTTEINTQNVESGDGKLYEIALNNENDSLKEEEKVDPLLGYRPVVFNPEDIVKHRHFEMVEEQQEPEQPSSLYMTPTGEILGTVQGIVDGLEEAVVDEEVAKELGKPGMTEDKIAELISGESEMLREAHVMGVDFNKIKPIVESLHNSEVLKALNEELIKTQEAKRKEEERKWTTFLQKPKRPVPRAKYGYYAYVAPEEPEIECSADRVKLNLEPYKVKIVKQPKPKVAPDYKPENFDTGPLPWEERALNEPTPPPIEPEEPILVPEEVPEFLEAVDPLPESEVPDLEETGIPLPPPKPETEDVAPPEEVVDESEEIAEVKEDITEPEPVVEETQKAEDMENKIANQLIASVQSIVDPNATLDQQLSQMRAQLAALAQLPGVIQQTLEMVTKQLSQITIQESVANQQLIENVIAQNEVENHIEPTIIEEVNENGIEESVEEQNIVQEEKENVIPEMKQPSLTQEELEKLRKEEAEMLEEQRRIEKQKKDIIEEMRQEQESRQLKQRPTPRVGKPRPAFGPIVPQERPLVLPGGRKWRGPKDAYNEQFFAETLTSQAELIQGKTKGISYESALLPFDERINFMKYEKPPVSLDHLQNSDVYKLVHNMDQTPVKRVEMLTPVVAEVDYRQLEVLVDFGTNPVSKLLDKTLTELKSQDGVKEAIYKDGAIMVETTLPNSVILDLVAKTSGKRTVLQGFGDTQSAVAMVTSQSCCSGKVVGVVRFQQAGDGALVADGSIDGLTTGPHGLHVHEVGDLSRGCQSIGDHFNPYDSPHGGPQDPKELRHAGDLGNIVADEHGRATFRIQDSVLKIWDIIGRSVAVTERQDDLGRGGSAQSKINGDSGGPVACGIIARSAGVFQNPKRICACDGVVVWDERDKPLAGRGRREEKENNQKNCSGCCNKEIKKQEEPVKPCCKV
ncbi:titin-like [Achroia grisella]|uniref:titin-like n=1 Tax=Achroia grisella TaxID=688607 RepID=UPI0027D31677|nr:titin-like [Achroia grisella]